MIANCGVYARVNKVNGKRYIGSSRKLDKRDAYHRQDLVACRHPNAHLQSAWAVYGSGAFTTHTLLNCAEEDLLFWEDWCIRFFGSMDPARGYNLCSADRQVISEETRRKMSESRLGMTFTEEHKARIGAASRGRKTFKGRKHTEATKAKISLAKKGQPGPNKGRVFSEQWRLNLGKSHKGLPVDQETRLKISEAHRGKAKSPEAVRKSADARRGVKRTPEACRRISEALQSPEVKAKISAANKGKKRSEETKARISSAQKGKPWTEAQRAAQARRKQVDIT